LSALHTGCLYPLGNIPGIHFCCGPGSIVGIVIGYGLGGLGSNPCGGEIFRTCPDLSYNGYQVFPGVKEQLGRDADPSPLFSAVVMKG
jgi:hypothetical protein